MANNTITYVRPTTWVTLWVAAPKVKSRFVVVDAAKCGIDRTVLGPI